MRRPVTLLWGLVLLTLTMSGSLSAVGVDSRSPLILPNRMIDIRFVVDNSEFLDKKFLELVVQEDRFSRRVISIHPDQDNSGSAVAEIPVPDGPINVVVCGFVNCGGETSTELFCGESKIPSYLEVDKIHEIHFSTNWACEQTFANQGLPKVGLAKSQ